MSVSRTDYLMFGVNIDPESFKHDDFEAEMDGAPTRRFDLVYDGMCGNYCIAGKIIARSDSYDGIEMVKIDPEKLNPERSAMAEAISQAFGLNLSGDEFSLILFSHFS